MKTLLSDRLKRFLSISLSFLVIISIPAVAARAGTLDPTFGTGGKFTASFPDSTAFTGLPVPSLRRKGGSRFG
jgi:hypothetical protein